MRSNTGCAVVVAGSGSDKQHIDRVVEALKTYGIPYQLRICSAHKQPTKLEIMIHKYNIIGGSVAYITIAGETDGLSGVVSHMAMAPVISCPPDSPNESCLTNPPGSSNAYIARPENVARFIAQLYAGVNPKFREALESKRKKKLEELQEQDRHLTTEMLWIP